MQLGIDETLIKYIILPTNPYYIAWLTFISIVYIVSYWSDLFDMAFDLTPLLIPRVKIQQSLCSFLMIIDIVLYFFVAKDKDGKERHVGQDCDVDEPDQEVETMAIGSFKIQRSLTLAKQKA